MKKYLIVSRHPPDRSFAVFTNAIHFAFRIMILTEREFRLSLSLTLIESSNCSLCIKVILLYYYTDGVIFIFKSVSRSTSRL